MTNDHDSPLLGRRSCSAISTRPGPRNHVFDLARILFATLVLLAHAPELTDGNRSREVFSRITHSGLTFGSVGVDGFFVLSGFLIVQSWHQNPDLLNFLRKRILRIVPGYLVAVLLSTLAVGLVAPGIPSFFKHFTHQFPVSIALLSAPITPPVLPLRPHAQANGALWTIAYEFRCYLMVALLGLCGLLKRRNIWLGITCVLMAIHGVHWIERHLEWRSLHLLFGDPFDVFRLTAAYFVGGSFYLFRDKIPYRPATAVVATVLLGGLIFIQQVTEPALILLGGYLLFYLSARPSRFLQNIRTFPDISYGLYLYGWPVEILWIWYFRGSPWLTFLCSIVLCCGLGWMSWHFVERPMLRLKRKSTALLPRV